MTSRFKIRCLSLFILFMSLRALGQGPIIPYRIGNNWGFTDTSKNIIIEPQYQAVNVEKTYPEGYYLVKKNDKWSVVTKNKEIIPAQLNDVMFEPHDKFIIDMLPDGKTSDYYNYRGERLFSGSVSNFWRMEQSANYLIGRITSINKMQSLFYYNRDTNVIDYWIVKDLNAIDKIHSKKQSYYLTDSIKERLGQIVWDNSSNRYKMEILEEVKLPSSLRPQNVEEPIEESARDYLNYNFEPILSFTSEEYLITKQRQVGHYKSEIRLDTIAEGTMPERYTTEYFKSLNSLITQNILSDTKQDETYLLYKSNGKYGSITKYGVVEPLYDSLIGMYYPSLSTVFYQVYNDGYFGIINATGEELLEVKYNNINFRIIDSIANKKYMILTLNNKKGLSEFGNNGLYVRSQLDCKYDDIEILGNYSISTKVKNTYGFSNILEPIFEYKVKGYKEFQRIKFFQIYSEDDQFLGYGDSNGKLFFED